MKSVSLHSRPVQKAVGFVDTREGLSVGYDRGFYVRGTPMWVDAQRRSRLCVLSGLLGGLPPRHERTLASFHLAGMLKRAGYKGHVLPTPCGRSVGTGGLKIMLWDAGGPMGSAAVLLEQRHQRMALLGLPTLDSVEVPPADILAVRAPALIPNGQPIGDIVEGLLDFVNAAMVSGQRGVILVDLIDVGVALHERLCGAGAPVRAIGILGKMLGPMARRKSTVSLGLGSVRQPAATSIAVVNSGLGAAWVGLPWVRERARTFRLRWLLELRGLERIVAKSGALRLLVASASALAIAEARQALGHVCDVQFVGPAQQLALMQRT